jgi:signal transduction histidine kinase
LSNTVQSLKKNAYTDYHFNILKNIAIYAAIALDKANTYKKLEKALANEIALSEHKDDLVNVISHQYKTPLSNINTVLQALKGYSASIPVEKIDRYIERIAANLDRMFRLIDDLLLFGKKYNPQSADLDTFCRSLVDEIKFTENSKHKIHYNSDSKTAVVGMDRSLMKIAVGNLIENSIKYSEKGSAIDVELARGNDTSVSIKVIDRGIGIPADYLKMKFKRFLRGSNVGNIDGTGLGLAIVERYVKLHKGHIEIESKERKGTTVTVTIPLLPEANEAQNNK